MIAPPEFDVRRALDEGSRALHSCDTPRLDAELLLAHVLNSSRASVLARIENALSPEQVARYQELVSQRASGTPVAYLRGSVSWWNLDLTVSADVLIPRPDTEVLVERALDLIRERRARTVCDVGTGSGAIAVAVAAECRTVSVTAVDVSGPALRTAVANAERAGVAGRIRFLSGSLLGPVADEPDLILANLPYLSSGMMREVSAEVRSEPEIALYGGPDGLELYRRLLSQHASRRWQCPILCEIDPRQAPMTREMVSGCLPGAQVEFILDLAGRERVVEIHPA